MISVAEEVPALSDLILADSSWLAKHSRVTAGFVMALSAIFTIAIAVHSGPQLRYGDEQAYRQMAVDLIHRHVYTTDGLRPSAYRPPGYAWFLLPAVFLGASNVALRILNAICLSGAQLFLFLLVRCIARESTAAIAVILTLAYPVLLYSATLLFPQTLGSALLLCGLWLLLRSRSMTIAAGVVAGLVWGFLILTIPTFLVLAAVTIAAIGWRRRRARTGLVAAVAVIGLLLSGWSYRNYRVFHTFVLVSTNGGVNLLLGNSEDATGNSRSDALPRHYAVVGHSQPNEAAADRYYSHEAKQWILQHPGQAARLYVEKLIHYFGFIDNLTTNDTSSQAVSQTGRMAIMVLTYGPLLFLFGLRLALCRKFPLASGEFLLAGLYLLNAAFASLFFTRIRFRLPLDWLLLAVVAGAMEIFLSGLSRGEFVPLLSGRKIDRRPSAEALSR
jgi:4-amino-4-deoxy-L-arabinose transferase-like glycosyltransferase